MPDTFLSPTEQPPTIRARLFYHPLEVALAAWWVLIGGLLIVQQLSGFGQTSVTTLPPLVSLGVTALVAVGGAVALVGLFWTGRHRTTAWLLERAGWFLGGGGWLCYGLVIAFVNPTALVSISLAALMVVTAALRIVVLVIVERRTRRRVERMGLA